jgi:hypothetical protein
LKNSTTKETILFALPTLHAERRLANRIITMTGSSVTSYKTYFKRYNDEALDPFAGDYGDLMATFRASIGREAQNRPHQLYE